MAAEILDRIFGRTGNRLFQMAYLYAQWREGKIPDFYLQDPVYFGKYRHELQAMLRPQGEPIDAVSVHVRRGKNPANPDEPAYSENPFYADLSRTGYYEKAMAEFPGERLLVFSDDINWCARNPMFRGCEFSSRSEAEDFSMMARCKGHVIANSSFSWWAAYLSGNRTVAPKQWYSDGVERTKVPEEWKQI